MIEMIAVLVVIAIMAAVATPAISSISDTRAAMAAKQLVHDLTFARQRAIATGSRCWVVFDTATNSWSVRAEPVGNAGYPGAVVLDDPSGQETYETTLGVAPFHDVLLTNVNFDSTNAIGFNWRGRPLNANETDLTNQGEIELSGGHFVTVEIITGYVGHVVP